MKRESGALKTLRLLLQRSLLSHQASIRLDIISFDMLEVIDVCRGLGCKLQFKCISLKNFNIWSTLPTRYAARADMWPTL